MGFVLVVDDEPDHRTTVRGILQRDGVTVSVAATVDEAFQAIHSQRYDVAIVDLRLPGRDGLAVMHGLRRIQPWLEVVILTAYPSPATCRAALSEGAAAYLEKPFSPEALRALVATLLDRARGDRGDDDES